MPARKDHGCVVLIVSTVLVGVVLVGGILLGSKNGDHSIEAEQVCERYIRDQLVAPASATFGGLLHTNVLQLTNGEYRVIGYVDAQNQFGALLRSDYICAVANGVVTEHSLTPR